MPCYHKFYDELRLTRLTFEPEALIVGSFSPAWPVTNDAGWFYGRTESSCLWDVLPRLYQEPSLINATPQVWRDFCADNKIAITDIIACVEDADQGKPDHQRILGGFSDEAIVHHFGNFEFVDVAGLLKQHPSIKHVYLTRDIRDAFWRHLWGHVIHYANHNELYERQLLTPSVLSKFQHSAYNKLHPEQPVFTLEDYVLMRWQEVWHK